MRRDFSYISYMIVSASLLASCKLETSVTVTRSEKPATEKSGGTNSTSTGTSSSSNSDTTAPQFTTLSLTTAVLDFTTTPSINIKVSENATVTLYRDASCTVAITSATPFTADTTQTVQTNALATAAKTTIYAKAADTAGNTSSCAAVGAFTNIMKFADPNPGSGNGFGGSVVELTNGNVVITSPTATVNGVSGAGAVYLFNGTTGALISTLYGSTTNDKVGENGVTALPNGHFVVVSGTWDCNATLCPAINATVVDVGAVTWGSGTSGVSGPVSSSNSLVGSLGSLQNFCLT
jgi:hypothetical protein